jgi:cytochrome c-type biogenesis protein CcmH/NrfG
VEKNEPRYAKAWDTLGYTYGYLKRYHDAIEAYRQALLINPEQVNARYCLGLCFVASDNRLAALDAVRVLRRLDPEKADDLFSLIVPR